MAMVNLTKPSSSPSPFESSNHNNKNNNNNLRDVSFSSYLDKDEKDFVRKLISETSPNPISTQSRNKDEDGEIGVFGAEKYFNGVIEEPGRRSRKGNVGSTKHPLKKQQQFDQDIDDHSDTIIKPRINFGSTPSVRSESSWNSQSALLPPASSHHQQLKNNIKNNNNLNSSARSRKGKTVNNSSKKSFFLSSLGCKYCSCSDKNSVNVNEEVGEISFNKSTAFNNNNITKRSVQDEEGMINFTFQTSKLGLKEEEEGDDDDENEKEHKSLEVFGSPVLNKTPLSLEKKLTIMGEEIEFFSKPDDMESDASSDLFEIEGFTASKSNPFLTRQGSSNGGGYAPSEASIEWSVVTASAADFSAMSDSEDLHQIKTSYRTRDSKETNSSSSRPSSMLLGCKSHKAVGVVGSAYRINYGLKDGSVNSNSEYLQGQGRRRSDSSMVPASVSRFEVHNESNQLVRGFSSRSQRKHQHHQYSPTLSHTNMLHIQ